MATLAMRLEHQHRDLEFVDAQMKNRIVKLARDLQRPERRALRDHAVDIGRRPGRHRHPRFLLSPSSMVQKTWAGAGRALRWSQAGLSPPVPGNTASSGTSGSATAAAPSSARMMWSVASANS